MKWPFVTRSRYERELFLLHSAYATSTEDLRQHLSSIIEKFSMVYLERVRQQGMLIHAKFQMSEEEFQQYCFSPTEKEELWWHVGKRVVEEIKKQARAIALFESSQRGPKL